MVNRLIALDKRLGICPIGIGECLRRAVRKAVMLAAEDDVKLINGTDQVCAGLEKRTEKVNRTAQSLDFGPFSLKHSCWLVWPYGFLLVSTKNVDCSEH